MLKYQHNFNLLKQEVLRSAPHLFTDEKIFMESFSALSGDSQRLFVRLYTRKGPWFWLSNVSYSEVSNLQEAIKELLGNGFLCLLEDANELHDDIKEICNLLTVSELCEILSVLHKRRSSNQVQESTTLLHLFCVHMKTGYANVYQAWFWIKQGSVLEYLQKLNPLSGVLRPLNWHK